MSFVQREVEVEFAIGGAGVTSGASSVKLKSHRVITNITCAGPKWYKATAYIFGMSLAHMNSLTVAPWAQLTMGRNFVQIKAGDAINGMSVVFNGTIMQAWPDMQASPQVPFRVDAMVGGWEKVNPKEPTSFPGAVPASTVHETIAGKMDATPENSGVKAIINNPYMWGPAYTQMHQLAKATRVSWILENGVLAMWPQGQARNSQSATIISRKTGMVGYPMSTPAGIVVRTLFNKAIKIGTYVTVESDIAMANGKWFVKGLDYELDAQMPNGRWFCILNCGKTAG